MSEQETDPMMIPPVKGSIHVHREKPDVRVKVLSATSPLHGFGSVVYRRVGVRAARMTALNTSRFFSLYRVETP